MKFNLNIRERLAQYKRTIEVSRKPDREEFMDAVRITGTGIIVIGVIGLIMFLIYYLLIGRLVV